MRTEGEQSHMDSAAPAGWLGLATVRSRSRPISLDLCAHSALLLNLAHFRPHDGDSSIPRQRRATADCSRNFAEHRGTLEQPLALAAKSILTLRLLIGGLCLLAWQAWRLIPSQAASNVRLVMCCVQTLHPPPVLSTAMACPLCSPSRASGVEADPET